MALASQRASAMRKALVVAVAIAALVSCTRVREGAVLSERTAERRPEALEPAAERVAVTSAMNVLVSAHCHRAHVCKVPGADAACAGAAAMAHENIDLVHCPRGVIERELSACADAQRTADCAVDRVREPACKVARLCATRP